ncbi:MAG: DUF4080 domain-containing protein [Proteobacteria bacterium]|jgi:radical SAM superfamily enzyme YgiQ (UPF0313 family)|nr:DUF4080 domain-containing protein [Pseudomonadota bacterium]
MTDIVLVAANARYGHTALGPRCLLANLGDLRPRTALLEVTIDDRPADVAERILASSPRVVGMSTFVWSVQLLTEIASILRQVAPDLRLVVGGPEVICPGDLPPLAALADVVVHGEADLAFADVARRLLAAAPVPHLVAAEPPDLAAVALPYGEYTDADLAQRTIYVEASRGCPNGCEFCLSSVAPGARRFPEERVLAAVESLWERGARRFKFVDRSVEHGVTTGLLDFFLERAGEGAFVHLEIFPGAIPPPLLERIASFPAGAVQLEAGVQSLSDAVASRVGRRQDGARVEAAIRGLVEGTRTHVHADLIAGLPGEGFEGIAESFDRLRRTGVHEIQIGVLKRLRGARIARHDAAYGMAYRETPPYDVLSTSAVDFAAMQRLKRAARVHDLVCNSGRFPKTSALLLDAPSPFRALVGFADFLHARVGAPVGIALPRLAALLFEHLTEFCGLPKGDVADAIADDTCGATRRRLPGAIREHVTRWPAEAAPAGSDARIGAPRRQRRHARGRPGGSGARS